MSEAVTRAVRTELPGVVLEVAVTVGDRVAAGDEICLLESMKMEIPIQAPVPGRIADVLVRPGGVLPSAAPVVTIELSGPDTRGLPGGG